MPREPKAPTPSFDVLTRRADAAYEYRYRNRAAVNEKARARMQRRREALRKAPAAVQAEEAAKARQYRRTYKERNRPVARAAVGASPLKKQPKCAPTPKVQVAEGSSTPRKSLRSPAADVHCCFAQTSFSLDSPPQPWVVGDAPRTPPSPTPASRKKKVVPRSLAEIAASDSEDSEM
ncbi:hypothetical protein C8R47DRAFT_1075253 [Mycena vitilis]|nr:hypothetical protein C8R47DRAFT_1075253 [Mycena vitilis]